MASRKLVFALVVCMMVIAPIAYAVDCNQVTTYMAPCIGYLRTSGAGAVPANCCSGVRALNNAATSTVDKRKACQCLQNAAKAITTINPTTAAGLPAKCGVNIPYKISTSTNCASIK